MKKAIILVLVLVLCMAMAAAQSLPRMAALQISMINQEPDPAEPGNYVDVRFMVENIGTDAAEDVTVELLPEYPFSLEPGKSAVKSLGTLQSRQMEDKAVIVKYRLKVAESAVEGENDLKLRYKINRYQTVELDPFMIDIRTADAIISIDSVELDTERIKPGQESVVTISLTNIADSLLRNIKVTLDLDDVPLAPSSSSDEINVKAMDAGSTKRISFLLRAEPDAESGLYKIPITIDYKDEIGNAYEKENTLGIEIGDAPDLIVDIEESEVFMNNQKGAVTVQFINKGVSDIKFVFVKVKPSDQFEIIGLDEAYVGKIDSDDYETADFTIFSKSKEDITLPLSLTYMDANNNEYTEEINLNIRIYDSKQAKQLGLSAAGDAIGIIILVVIVVAGVVGYLWWRKRKKNKKQAK